MSLFNPVRSVAASLLVLASISLATPSQAEWRRAESDNFIIYGEGRAASLTEFARKLESFDRILRTFLSVPAAEGPKRKLPIYVVGSQRDLRVVNPAIGVQVAGFYVAAEEDIFATAWRQLGDQDFILFHEYGHHFMLQHFPSGYPAWFVEGFAEYFASARIVGQRADVGLVDADRGYALFNARWLPITDLLTKSPDEIDQRDESYYPLAGILTHWFLSQDGRRPQLSAYLRAVSRGEDAVQALKAHVGLTPDELERQLRSYIRGRVGYREIRIEAIETPAVVTELPASADDVILLGQRLKMSIKADDGPALLAQVRSAATPHRDPFALKVLAHAEMKLGDRAAAESLLQTVLEQSPSDVEALQLMARLRLDQANDLDDLAAADSLRAQARGFLGRAYQLDEADFRTYYLLAESRRTAANYPTANDIDTLSLAYALAPQLAGARFNLAGTLIYAGRTEEGIALLTPLVNDPHNRSAAAAARGMIEQARSNPQSRQVLDDAEAAEDIEPETTVEPEPAPAA